MSTEVEAPSVAELENALSQQKKRLRTLERRRENLLQKIEAVDEEIAQLRGTSGTDGRHGPRAKNDKPLRAYVIEVLGRYKKGLPLAKLADKVREAGYQSNSSKFNNTVYQCTYHSDEITRDPDSGNYVLVK